jgi:hypothetical protein
LDLKLSLDDISALQSVDADRGPALIRMREDELPKKLFEFNLVRRQPGGPAVITQSGQRALFRHECVLALEALSRGERIALGSGVGKWLVASGFAKPSDDVGHLAILPRGRLWLTSLAPEADMKAASPSAESFARRRA